VGNPSIYRYEVPVDDQWHEIELTGDLLHVDSRDPTVVEFWAFAFPSGPVPKRRFRVFRVFGTGHPLPQGHLRHHGSVVVAGGQLVWHLLELTTGG
jgi:hypothetical protein